MNCRPGDLAMVISANPQYNGRIVEVLYATPRGRYILPDGYPAIHDDKCDCWIVKFVGGPSTAPLDSGGVRKTWYGSGADHCMRPLRGDPDALPVDPAVAECD